MDAVSREIGLGMVKVDVNVADEDVSPSVTPIELVVVPPLVEFEDEEIQEEEEVPKIELLEVRQFVHQEEEEQSVLKQCFLCEECASNNKKCPHICYDEQEYNQHLEENALFRPYKCSICPRRFVVKYRMEKHQRLIHKSSMAHYCASCGKGFPSTTQLYQHEKHHKNLKVYTCLGCDRRFAHKTDLNEHVDESHKCSTKIFGPKPTFECPVCQKRFITKNKLESHKIIHERRYLCVICGKGFTKHIRLKEHASIHENRREFVCEVCGLGFNRQSNLRAHRFRHTKPCVCDLCGLGFAVQRELKIHQRICSFVTNFHAENGKEKE